MKLILIEQGFTEDAAKFYAAEVLIAIEYLHSIRIVYRDLKPEVLYHNSTLEYFT